MVFNILRLLPRNKLFTTGFDGCARNFHRVSTLQNKILDSEIQVEEQTKIVQPTTDPLDHDDYFNVKSLFTLKELFDARVHLGHYKGCYDSLTRSYIYGMRSGMHIIDLNQTVSCLTQALNVLSHIVYKRGVVCFVTTNARYDFLIQKTARSCGEYFITRHFAAGTFVNAYHQMNSERLPDLLVCFQTSRFERVTRVMHEASRVNIPIIGIVDTDCNPQLITYPVPGNDDTPDSVTKFCSIFQKAVLNAKERRVKDEAEEDETLKNEREKKRKEKELMQEERRKAKREEKFRIRDQERDRINRNK